jgi:photosystem II stability/assembly factor-like uncharacterized protein
MFVLLAIVLTLVTLPSVVMAAGGQSLSATVATMFGASGSDDLGHKPPPHPYPPGGTVPHPTPRPIPPHPVPPPKPVYPTAAPKPVYPTATPAPSGSAPATLGTYKLVKVIGDRLSSTIYAYTDNDWLYRSDRDGRGWYMVITNPAVDDFIMSPSDPSVLYSGTGPDCGGSSVAIAPMYKSVDSGETWTELPAGLDLKPMLIDPTNADIVFAADCTTLYLSTDGGETWTPKPDAAADNIWQTYAPADMSSGSLVGSPPPATPHWDQIFAVGTDVQGVGLVAFTGDQGASWANITNPEDAPQEASVVLASLSEGGKLWVVSSQGVWSTADYGVNWSLSKTGLEYLIKTNTVFNDLAYGYNGSLYLATDKGLYIQSEPDGVWKLPDPDDVDFGQENMKSLLITESNPTRLWINAEDKDGDPIVFTMAVK